jgi:aspartate carbamoyltransferase catalytic subunit
MTTFQKPTRSAILDQVEMGVAVRQAVLELVLAGK